MDLRSRVLTYTEDLPPDGEYHPPGESERERLADGVAELLTGDAAAADQKLAPLGLGVTRLTDTASGRRYDEIAAAGPGPAAQWGRLYLTADSSPRWNVQVPHPTADRHTDELGTRLLEETPGGALVVAGAHRRAGDDGAADVAHREDSAFHTIVVELQQHGVPGVQLHGFADADDRPYDAVLSTGAAENTLGEVTALADRMERDGLEVCRGWQSRCPLEGATNVQGKAAQRLHVPFVHVELAPGARGTGSDASVTADALADLTATWNDG
ncbi:hypothetical protein ACFRI7_04510 [Streptomyces sp. NPDC056716]|uniref:hypothetical protein n=1 Tax=unclassified Streptomyces TaxID=2593676 RepID=UPI00369D4523